MKTALNQLQNREQSLEIFCVENYLTRTQPIAAQGDFSDLERALMCRVREIGFGFIASFRPIHIGEQGLDRSHLKPHRGGTFFGLSTGTTSTGTAGGTQNSTKHSPVLIRVQLFAANLPIENALDLGALRDIADDAELFPMRDRLLRDADQVGKLGLCASELNRALDSGLIRGRGAHGSLVSDYKRICSTGHAELQAHLKALDTKSFV